MSILGIITENPFEAIEYELEPIKLKRDDKEIEVRHFHVRYVVGETDFKHYVGKGDTTKAHTGKTLLGVHIIHKVGDNPFHYDDTAVEKLVSTDKDREKISFLKSTSFHNENHIIQVALETPESIHGHLTKDEAKNLKAGLVYWAGYHIDTSGGFVRLALAKTVDPEGNIIFDKIHVIPESIIRAKKSLITK